MRLDCHQCLLPWRSRRPSARSDRLSPAFAIARTCCSLLAAASFVEYASDTYAGNLADFVRRPAGHRRVAVAALGARRGAARTRLARSTYEAVWPVVRLGRGVCGRFFDEYRALCGVDGYAPSQRSGDGCTLHRGDRHVDASIKAHARPGRRAHPEVSLCEHIRNDEVRHYKHFLQFFDRYDAHEKQQPLSRSSPSSRAASSRPVTAMPRSAFGMPSPRCTSGRRTSRGPAASSRHSSRVARMVRTALPRGAGAQDDAEAAEAVRRSASSLIQPILTPVALADPPGRCCADPGVSNGFERSAGVRMSSSTGAHHASTSPSPSSSTVKP